MIVVAAIGTPYLHETDLLNPVYTQRDKKKTGEPPQDDGFLSFSSLQALTASKISILTLNLEH